MKIVLSLLLTVALIAGCSSTMDIPYKGADLNSLEQAANYINTKKAGKRLLTHKIRLEEKPFLLGAFDVRDGIDARISEDLYAPLYEQLQKRESPIAGTTTKPVADVDLSSAPNGLTSPIDAFSYLTARAIAKTFGKSGIKVTPESMLLGLKDADTKLPPKLSDAEEKQLSDAIREKMLNTDDDWAENRKQFYADEEKKFFSNNITKPGVIALESGVQYIVVKQGKGKPPRMKDSIVVNYRGALLDGTEFDSNAKRGKPDNFEVNDLVLGFGEAITQVSPGSRVLIYIPARLAYGEKGAPMIPPNAAIAFEVELLEVKSSFF